MIRRAVVAPAAPRRARIAGPAPQGTQKPAPLVNTDEELIGYLEEAERLIKDADYPRAIKILQALLERPDSGFVPAEGGLYVALNTKANELMGQMRPEGLKLYRQLYDAPAKVLFEKAMRTGEVRLLRRVAAKYLHTSFGAKALDELGGVYFDNGRFGQAAYCWLQMLRLPANSAPPALLLARAACSYHLAGESGQAERLLEKLEKEFPDAREMLAGRNRNVVEFTERILSIPAADWRRSPAVLGAWPGLGGLPRGIAVMPDCEVVLAPGWLRRAEGASDYFVSGVSLMAAGLDRLGADTFAVTARIRSGHVVFEAYQNNRLTFRGRLSGMLHPVIVGDAVICRADSGVKAFDLMTGRSLWQAPDLPMVRQVSVSSSVRRSFSFSTSAFPGTDERVLGDSGAYMLTAGEGKLFVRYGFLPASSNLRSVPGIWGVASSASKVPSDTSALAAIDVAPGVAGKLLWRIGNGRGEDDVVRAGKFVSPPTCHDGRLYVIVFHVMTYYMVCLDAETGATIWRAGICQPPAALSGYSRHGAGARAPDVASPPAVADGKVFALPNIGVLVAMDADTGETLWANHYHTDEGEVHYGMRRFMFGSRSVNPIIVSADRLICLPADSESLLAFRPGDGSLLWRANRSGCRRLSAIDEDRVVLSGPGLVLVSTEGKELHRASGAEGIVGLPAVTERAVLASGQGRLFRLDLQTNELRTIELADADGLLGNLVSARGILVAGNPAGLCAYLPFDAIRAGLDERIAGAAPQDRARLLFRKAQLALNAEAAADALKDLLAARELARRFGDTALDEQLRTWIYRTYLAVGNRASNAREMRAGFRKALEVAATAQERAHTKLRLAKAEEMLGELSAAAALAQEISENYAAQQLVDVPIGEDADVFARFDEHARLHTGKELAQAFIRRLLEIHGRGPYAEFDALAGAALAAATDAQDPEALGEVHERWPNSIWADDALYAAAEIYAKRADAAGGPEAEKLLGQARKLLSEVAGMGESPLRLPAGAVTAALHARDGKVVSAGYWCDKVRSAAGYDPDVPVAFGNIRGALGKILTGIEKRGLSPAAAQVAYESFIDPPLEQEFCVPGQRVQLLRDQQCRPVRVGEKLLALRGDKAVLIDAAAADENTAISWLAVAPVDSGPPGPDPVPGISAGTEVLGGLSRDGGTIVIAGRTEARAYDVETAKIRWRVQMSELGLRPGPALSVGDDVLVAIDNTGRIASVDITSGGLLSVGRLPGVGRSPAGPAAVGLGVALVTDTKGEVTCFDISNGKVIDPWRAGDAATQGYVSPNGFLVLIENAGLAVREVQNLPDGRKRISEPIWRSALAGKNGARILAVSGELIAVRPGLKSNGIEVYSLMGGSSPLASFRTADLGGAPTVAILAAFSGDGLYAACTPSTVGRRMRMLERWLNCQGLSVQKFDVPSNRLLWRKDISNDPAYILAIAPLAVGRDHLAVSVLRMGRATVGELQVLDAAEGRTVFGPTNLAGGPEGPYLSGPAVITGGRLCFETAEGVKVYGSQ